MKSFKRRETRPAPEQPQLLLFPDKQPVFRVPEVIPAPALPGGMTLFARDGARLYLTAAERGAFLKATEQTGLESRTLCLTLAYSGCRLSEALALTAGRVDLAGEVLVFESLKKRRSGVYRTVPVPSALLSVLDSAHGVRELQAQRDKGRDHLLWPWSRVTGWRAVHDVMETAGLVGPHACPKGLRHGFGVAAVSAGIPLNLVQRWLGHAQLTTTAIYASAVGKEEQHDQGQDRVPAGSCLAQPEAEAALRTIAWR